MVERVYLLLDIRDGNVDRVVATLRRQPGIVAADALEVGSRVIALFEAESRRHLARLTIEALASVEMMTEALSLMPVRNGSCEQGFLTENSAGKTVPRDAS